jgi:hypothetical protein
MRGNLGSLPQSGMQAGIYDDGYPDASDAI